MQLENYRHYLWGEFEKRKVRNPHYSLRAFARDLGTVPSRLSEALNGKRGISSDLAERMIQKLELKDRDADIFRLSVEAEHARSRLQKNQAQTKLQQALAQEPTLPPKTFTIVDWITEAILKISERETLGRDLTAVAARLDIPEFMAVNAMRFLTRLGLIRGAKNYKTYLEARGQGRRLNIDYVQILEQAQKAYAASNASDSFQHQALLLEVKDIKKAQAVLARAFSEVQKFEKKTKNSKVIFFASQIFSVEKGK